MIWTQDDLRKKRKNINIFYKIKDLQCNSMILSGFKNNFKDKIIYYEKRNGLNQKICNSSGYWVWLDTTPNNIFWLSEYKLEKEFNILYCYSGIRKI